MESSGSCVKLARKQRKKELLVAFSCRKWASASRNARRVSGRARQRLGPHVESHGSRCVHSQEVGSEYARAILATSEPNRSACCTRVVAQPMS